MLIIEEEKNIFQVEGESWMQEQKIQVQYSVKYTPSPSLTYYMCTWINHVWPTTLHLPEGRIARVC